MSKLLARMVLLLMTLFLSVMSNAQEMTLMAMDKPSEQLQLNLLHIFIGSGLMLSLMCFAWARALRSYTMAILALFFALKSLAILVAGGVSLFTLITDSEQVLKIEGMLLANLSTIIFYAFTIKFLMLKKHRKNSYQLLVVIAVSMILVVPLSLLLDQTATWYLSHISISVGLLALLYVSRSVSEISSRLVAIFSLILIIQLSFNALAYLLYYWHFPAQQVNSLDMLAFWLMAVMVAYLMGRKYYCHRLDERRSQQQVLQSIQASDMAQQKLLALQEESQEQLESRVQERTIELNIALQELEAVNQVLKEKNTLDELSGLYNRRYYDEKIMAEFRRSRRNLTPLSIVLIDIDHFKAINDSYGHLAGDKCIVEVATRIHALLRRSTDVGCRYGGEEFCLILPETDDKGAFTLAQEVCHIVRQEKFYHNESVIELTVSCGVTTYQQESNVTPEVLFERVDKALYQAKQKGRDQVQVSLLSEI